MHLHPPPNEVAIAHCPTCLRVTLATHVHRLDQIEPRYCRTCGGSLGIHLYTHKSDVLGRPKPYSENAGKSTHLPVTDGPEGENR